LDNLTFLAANYVTLFYPLGRRKVYRSNAARQAAYRRRKCQSGINHRHKLITSGEIDLWENSTHQHRKRYFEQLKRIPDTSVDLIITSPPYADKRSDCFEVVRAKDYTKWFLPISGELLRILRPTGSFILNLKEGVERGERQTYVYELVLALKAQGWKWVDDYAWVKLNGFPGKWATRFADRWAHCYHFTKSKKFAMFQKEVMVPARWKARGTEKAGRAWSSTRSGLSRDRAQCAGREMVHPTNVVSIPVGGDAKHPAAFPVALPEWFIRLFTQPGDVVLDPFLGSGSTAGIS
jgi:site-specific DNA-methyltransferase (adenine-specific)